LRQPRSRAKANWRETGERPMIATAMRWLRSRDGVSSAPMKAVHIGHSGLSLG